MDYDNTNKGALWKLGENDYNVIMQGKINMNGFDRKVILVKRKNAQGQDTFEMFESVANIKKVEDKTSDKHPDGKGVIEVRKVDKTMGIAFWRRQKKDGEGFLSVSLSEPQTPQVGSLSNDVDKIKEAFPDSKVLKDDAPF